MEQTEADQRVIALIECIHRAVAPEDQVDLDVVRTLLSLAAAISAKAIHLGMLKQECIDDVAEELRRSSENSLEAM